ncbi:MAG: transposase family protein [Jatrophihabitantaceae bacterium]
MSSTPWARAALSHSAFTGITEQHLGRVVAELAVPWQAGHESALAERRGHERRREQGAGGRYELVFTDRVVLTLVVLRLQIPHAALAVLYGVDRCTVTRAVRQIRPLLARRGYATPAGPRLGTLADVFAYAEANGITLRADGSEIQVRRPRANKPGRRAFVSGKKKQNTIKFTKWCDPAGRTLLDSTFRTGRMHDQTGLHSDGVDDLFEQFPTVQCELDSGYRGLHRDHPAQAHVPPLKPKQNAPADQAQAWEQDRHAQSSRRICVEHAIADSKNCRPLQRWIGRRDNLAETILAVGSLVSDRATTW